MMKTNLRYVNKVTRLYPKLVIALTLTGDTGILNNSIMNHFSPITGEPKIAA
jgi:hypothetical protein